jgi:TrmH family RNA methyltransferase
VTTITSLHNDRVKLVRALQTSSRTRRQEGKIVLEGTRLVGDALAAGAQPDFFLVAPEVLNNTFAEKLTALNTLTYEVSPEILAHASDTEMPQGIIAVVTIPELAEPEQPTFTLILDAIADPGNLGTILRTAAAAGVDLTVVAPNSVDIFNPKVLRSAMGAHFRLPIVRWSWVQIAEHCKNRPLYLADAEGDVAYDQVDWRTEAALIIGGEARGADQQAWAIASQKITIPMARSVESLNAGIAAGVILFEMCRQRRTQR